MSRQPRNKIWSSFHDPVYDFRVIAEFTQRFPHLQFVWFARHTPESVAAAGYPGMILDKRHVIQFRTDRAGLASVGLPRSAIPRNPGEYKFSPQSGPSRWSVKRDMRCSLSYVVHFWLIDGIADSSHPFHWLEPARLEATPFDGDLDSIVWGEPLRKAA